MHKKRILCLIAAIAAVLIVILLPFKWGTGRTQSQVV